jgi:putative ferrous iron transport protein C
VTMLGELRSFVVERKVATLSEIALHLGVDVGVAEAMCRVWVNKGRLEQVDTAQRCGDCRACEPGIGQIYRWRG